MYRMGASVALKAILLVLAIFVTVEAQVDQKSMRLMNEAALEWPSTMSVYDELDGNYYGEEEGGGGGSGGGAESDARRSLYWSSRARHYYISYGALSANRVPCPPRSGRSYYTHNCYRARTPANPYTRGCSCIAHCRS